ncbi:hypothetical protein PUNSTDRAFT_145742 [Punctularia strigosozonata HHB-11173 SS5]|uniref:uncharacterized protein n=1 Tax=Punctularia strigosozonata (strain HHB-11173) TaxID=741275 RepID=UPI00044163FD|nr:uncharacterized protein PUNSTDRAFT_145742 [Punctularia strigosozonata HHB-11173 SS5]EIN05836.1 hypothetical protein PUNSTDRAFT_145742 [Punctularia strigosozonata HHB-11173 SS5]
MYRVILTYRRRHRNHQMQNLILTLPLANMYTSRSVVVRPHENALTVTVPVLLLEGNAAGLQVALDDGRTTHCGIYLATSTGYTQVQTCLNQTTKKIRRKSKTPSQASNTQDAQSSIDHLSESESEAESTTGLATVLKTDVRAQAINVLGKRARPENDEESVTESESECEEPPHHTVKRAKTIEVQSEGSVTESESESESLIIQSADSTRPAFHRTREQPLLGPLVLDAKRHISVPRYINTFLRDYQREGIRFLWTQYSQGLGALLGDDMGLGKTVQIISFLSAIMRKSGDIRDLDRRRRYVSHLQDSEDWQKRKKLPPANVKWPTCLIIAPSTVVYNWEREFETWGFFEVGVYTGKPSDRKDVLRDFKMGRLDVVITSFDLARQDISLLDDLAWSVVIVDEVHTLKNPRSKTAHAYNQFKCQQRIGLTGTAIQNNYGELHTILDWTNPGRVGTPAQWQFYVTGPLTRGQSKACSEEERARANHLERQTASKIFQAQLPKKIDKVVFCPLTRKQILVYKRILAVPAVQDMLMKDDLCECGSRAKRKDCCKPWDKKILFQYMSALLKASNHLSLLLPGPGDTAEQATRVAFGPSPPTYGESMFVPDFCGKWLILESLLAEWREDPTIKVLIFTKSVKLLEILDYHLGRQHSQFVRLDGSTPQHDRMPLIDRFNNDPEIRIFLISTLAGGTGLNLTAANKVVIFDPNWNPAHDLQAMDRAYRFGQTRDVYVYRLLGAGSLEELIYARQLYKQQQMRIGYEASIQTRYFEGIQGDPTRKGELFGIKNIFTLHEDTLATKKAIEDAHLSSFDWALAHAEAKKRGKDAWVYDAEKEGTKQEPEMNGLGALLFDDSVKAREAHEVTEKALKAAGIQYAHANEDLLKTNPFEQQRAALATKVGGFALHRFDEELIDYMSAIDLEGEGKDEPRSQGQTRERARTGMATSPSPSPTTYESAIKACKPPDSSD